jgi:hypothetical protein
MDECLWDKESSLRTSPVDELLQTERELSLLGREAESLEAMRWLMTWEQEFEWTPTHTQQLQAS